MLWLGDIHGRFALSEEKEVGVIGGVKVLGRELEEKRERR